MDFWDALAVLRRRWWIVVPGLALTVVASVLVFQSIAPTYRSQGTVVFYAPGKLQLTDPNLPASRSNPFLGFDGSVTVTSEIVSRAVTSPTAISAVTNGVPGGALTVEPDINARGPILQLSADARQQTNAVTVLDRGISAVRTTLDAQQQSVGAEKDTWVQMAVLRADRSATPVSGSRWRAAISVLVLGIGAAIALSFVVDAIARARQRSREPQRVALAGPARATNPSSRVS